MKLRRRFISLAAVAAVIALICLLPALVSSPSVFRLLHKVFSSTIPGKLEVESCSFTWFDGISCKKIGYTHQRLGIRLYLPAGSSDKGLFTLLVAPGYLGEVTLQQPTLDFVQPVDVLSDSLAENPQSPGAGSQQLPISWWEQHSVRLRIKEGIVRSEEQAGAGPQVLAQNVAVHGDLADGTVKFRLDFQSDQTRGQFQAEGFVNLPSAGQHFLGALISESSFAVHSMEIEPIATVIANRFPQIPQASGIVQGKGTFYMAGIEDLDIKGEAQLNSLELSGGFLGRDHPRFAQAQLAFAGKRHPLRGWHLSRLELQSEPVSFTAKGILDSSQVQVAGQGRADIALLSTAFPHLLAIHQNTQVDKGTLDFSFQATGEPRQIDLQADCTTHTLELTQDDQVYTWKEPLALQLKAMLQPDALELRSLSLHAPFLEVQGGGKADHFQLQASADLDRLFSELDKLFALPVHARGQLNLELESTLLKTGLLKRKSELNIENFSLKLQGQQLVPQDRLIVQAETIGKAGYRHLLDLVAGELTAKGWPGTVTLNLAQEQKNSLGSPREATAPCQLDVALDLARVQSLVNAWSQRKNGCRLQGNLQVQTGGWWYKNNLYLHELKGGLDQFVLADDGGQLFAAQHMELSEEQSSLHQGGLHLRPLEIIEKNQAPNLPPNPFCRLSFRPFSFDLKRLHLSGPDVGLELQLQASGDVSSLQLSLQAAGEMRLLTPWWQKQGWLDPNMAVDGKAKGILKLQPRNQERARSTSVSLAVDRFQLRQGGQVLLEEPDLRVSFTLGPRRVREQVYRVTALNCETQVGRFTGGGLAHYGQIPTLLELHGQLQPASDWFTQALTGLISHKIDITQVDAGNILLSLPLYLPLRLQEVTLSGDLQVHGLRCFGMEIEEVPLAFDLNRSLLRAQIRGRAGQGQLAGMAEWRPQAGGLSLTIPQGTQLFAGLVLTPELIDDLLTQFGPFGSLLTATGRLGMRVNHFSLPLAQVGRRPDFNLVLDLHQATPQAIHGLNDLLKSAGLDSTPLRFLERELVCEGWNGAMTCAPLRLGCGNADLVITGSKGRNGSIRYDVKLPVTKQLLHQAGISAFGQFSATAHITGTQVKPIYKHKEFLRGLGGQITASLPKPLGSDQIQKASTVEKNLVK
nr:hypothetical protein [uncultured Desulfobulbus sp.]